MLHGLSPRSYSPGFGDFFGLDNQACLMKQFVEGTVEKPSWGDVGAACAERDVSKTGCSQPLLSPSWLGCPNAVCLETAGTGVCSESCHSSALGKEQVPLGWAFIFPPCRCQVTLNPAGKVKVLLAELGCSPGGRHKAWLENTTQDLRCMCTAGARAPPG